MSGAVLDARDLLENSVELAPATLTVLWRRETIIK